MSTKGKGFKWNVEDGETLLWQGRPAPRCYTFRNWKQALAGMALFLACSFWMFLGYQLVVTDGHSAVLLLMTVPLVAATFMLGPGQILLNRWRWENIYYALTDQRILLRSGLLAPKVKAFPVSDISGWQRRRFGEQLASIRLLRGDETPILFACIEYPELLTQHLPEKQPSADM